MILKNLEIKVMKNKLKTVSKYLATVMLCSCLILGTFADSASAITRSCTGEWVLQNPRTGGQVTLAPFSASGGCSKFRPNKCRIAARDAASKCMQTHWDTRWDRRKPDACQRGSRVSNYNIVDLKKEIERYACSAGWVNQAVKVEWKTTGKRKCGSSRTVHRGYKILPEMCRS